MLPNWDLVCRRIVGTGDETIYQRCRRELNGLDLDTAEFGNFEDLRAAKEADLPESVPFLQTETGQYIVLGGAALIAWLLIRRLKPEQAATTS